MVNIQEVRKAAEETLGRLPYEDHTLSISGSGDNFELEFAAGSYPSAYVKIGLFMGEVARIHRFNVAPRRDGQGKRLLGSVEDLLGNLGIPEISLSSRYEAVGFWEEMGFVELGNFYKTLN
jgi:GNAT superfamily N-acetyltransferase